MARLPTPGSDEGSWGTILNDYLTVAHDSSGALKPVAGAALSDGTVTENKLSPGIQSKLGKAETAIQAAGIANKIDTSLYATKGDILAASAAGSPVRLGVGNNNHVLTADSTQASGMTWKAVPESPAYPTQQMALHNVKAATVANFAAMANNQYTFVTNSTYCTKLWVPTPINISKIFWAFLGVPSGMSGWYTAFYDAAGSLISGSVSTDISGSAAFTFDGPGTTDIRSDGTSITIAAGYFYVVLRTGTAVTYPKLLRESGFNINMGLTSSDPAQAADSYRYAFASNAWSGATPPATLGTLSMSTAGIGMGVR